MPHKGLDSEAAHTKNANEGFAGYVRYRATQLKPGQEERVDSSLPGPWRGLQLKIDFYRLRGQRQLSKIKYANRI